MELTATKYDPQNDTHIPKVGDIQEGYEILKVKPMETSALMKMGENNEEPERIEGCDEVLVWANPDRPFLMYLVWAKKV